MGETSQKYKAVGSVDLTALVVAGRMGRFANHSNRNQTTIGQAQQMLPAFKRWLVSDLVFRSPKGYSSTAFISDPRHLRVFSTIV